MDTIEEWFSKFPEPWRTQLMHQPKEAYKDKSKSFSCASEALAEGLVWVRTRQGAYYWREVYGIVYRFIGDISKLQLSDTQIKKLYELDRDPDKPSFSEYYRLAKGTALSEAPEKASTKKTVREWIEDFPEPWRTEILGEAEKQDFADFNCLAPDKATALRYSILFCKTKRGVDGWLEIVEKLANDPEYLEKLAVKAAKEKLAKASEAESSAVGKPCKEWLSLFPEPWKAVLTKYHSKYPCYTVETQSECDDAGLALARLMLWRLTEEGHQRWKNIRESLHGATTAEKIREVLARFELPKSAEVEVNAAKSDSTDKGLEAASEARTLRSWFSSLNRPLFQEIYTDFAHIKDHELRFTVTETARLPKVIEIEEDHETPVAVIWRGDMTHIEI